MSESIDADRAAAPRLGTGTWVAVTFLLVAIGRAAFSADRRIFHISPDEPSQMAIARWLAGGPRWNMFDHATWQPGLATLLTPVYWFTDDGTTAVRWAFGVNAALGGAGAAVLVVLIRRLTACPPAGAAAAAIVVGLAPSSLSASAFVWAEPLVSLTFVSTVLALIHAYDTDRLRWAIAANVIAVAGYTSHSRLLVLVATTALLTLGREASLRRLDRLFVIGAITGFATLASVAWTRWILANVWDDPSDQNTVGSVWDRAQQPLDVADAAIGQVWYQLAATFGVVAYGVVVITRSLRRTATHDAQIDRIPTVDARLLAASTLPLLGLSAVFMSDRPRADQQIYGRYNDAVMWPILAIGLWWLARRVITGCARRDVFAIAATATTLVGTGVFVELRHGEQIREGFGVRSMIPGLLPFVRGDDDLDPRRVTVLSLVGLLGVAAIVALAGLRRLDLRSRTGALLVGSVAMIGLAAWGVVRLERVADRRLNGWERAAAIREIDELLPSGAAVGVKPVPTSQEPVIDWVPQRQRFQMYQLYLPERAFVRDRGVDDPNGPYVLAPLEDERLTEAGATVIWRDPGSRIGLWVEPGG